jgi:hypothetical protein
MLGGLRDGEVLVAADVALIGYQGSKSIGGPGRISGGQNRANRPIRAQNSQNNG